MLLNLDFIVWKHLQLLLIKINTAYMLAKNKLYVSNYSQILTKTMDFQFSHDKFAFQNWKSNIYNFQKNYLGKCFASKYKLMGNWGIRKIWTFTFDQLFENSFSILAIANLLHTWQKTQKNEALPLNTSPPSPLSG